MTKPLSITDNFKDNLAQLPAVDGLDRIDIVTQEGGLITTIPNMDGKRGSLAVYQYLGQNFSALDKEAAEQGLALFAEHVADARANPGAHPNVDLLIQISEGGDTLQIQPIAAE